MVDFDLKYKGWKVNERNVEIANGRRKNECKKFF